jgi:hypothetical protein
VRIEGYAYNGYLGPYIIHDALNITFLYSIE